MGSILNRNLIYSGLLLFLFLITSIKSYAAVFDKDDRREVYTDTFVNQYLSPSVAALVSPVYMKPSGIDFLMDFPTFAEDVSVCPTERFHNQPTAIVSCTGFLVGPDLLMTAGHCMTHQDRDITYSTNAFCSDFKWVFDYKYEDANNLNPVFAKENVASCKEVIYAKFDYKLSTRIKTYLANLFGTPDPNEITIHGIDIALIRLDRPLNRPYLNLNPNYQVGEIVSMIGHPNGLPQKYTPNGQIKGTITENYFSANLDAFDGNSGSPVFNQKKEVIGVLVRSFPDADYNYLKDKQCSVVNVCNSFTKTCQASEVNGEMFAQVQTIPEQILQLIRENTIISM